MTERNDARANHGAVTITARGGCLTAQSLMPREGACGAPATSLTAGGGRQTVAGIFQGVAG